MYTHTHKHMRTHNTTVITKQIPFVKTDKQNKSFHLRIVDKSSASVSQAQLVVQLELSDSVNGKRDQRIQNDVDHIW